MTLQANFRSKNTKINEEMYITFSNFTSYYAPTHLTPFPEFLVLPQFASPMILNHSVSMPVFSYY